jgi:N-acetylglucosaminyl-diphospho-decaprenol L-rhamnosyltransferase
VISILIVHYNRPDLLSACLASLREAQEVVVVDNGSLSNADKKRLQKAFPTVKWAFNDKNLGFSAGVNHAASLASGETFLLLNPDTQWDDGCFKALEAHFCRHDADILGLKQFAVSGDTQLSVGWEPTIVHETFRKFLQDGLNGDTSLAKNVLNICQREDRQISWVAGSALLTSRTLFESVGGFDERYFLYFEDIDFCLRARLQGAKVAFCSSFSLIHHGGACAATAQTSARQHYRDSQMLFFREHGSWFARCALPVWGQLRKWIKP